MSRRRAWSAAVGALLVVAYAVPLFVPPPAMQPTQLQAGAGLLQRIFPDVPAWWMMSRLVALVIGAGLIAVGIRRPVPLTLDRRTAREPEGHEPRAASAQVSQRFALFLASGLAVAGVYAAWFSRSVETLYCLCLAAPAGVLTVTEGKSAWRIVRSRGCRIVVPFIMPVIWVAWCVPTAWRSPRAANLVDMWIMARRLGEVAFGHGKLFAQSDVPGLTNAYLALDSLGLALSRPPLSFAHLQLLHVLLTGVCALIIGLVVWQMVALGAAVVAQAAFLFSPLTISFAYHPGPVYVMPLCVATLLLLLLGVRCYGSAAALAAFGALAGFSAGIPQLSVVTLVLCVFVGVSVSRFPRVPWVVVGIAVLSGVAALVPSLPKPQALAAMARETAFGRAQMSGVTMILFGQQQPRESVMTAARSAPFDVPLGALLAPFGIARTPLRLLGDTLLDPVGTALMAIGLALSVRQPRNRGGLLVVGLVAGGMASALVSSGDAVSHTRLAPALPPLAVLSGLGFEALRRQFAARWRRGLAASVAAALSASGGVAIYAAVNPTILPASWSALSVEALGAGGPNADGVLLDYGAPWSEVGTIGALLPERSVPALTFQEFQRSAAAADARTYFWSPALERDIAISCLICARSPDAELYTLTDEPGLSRAFAASPRGSAWSPDLPQKRWASTLCGTPLCRRGRLGELAVPQTAPQCDLPPW